MLYPLRSIFAAAVTAPLPPRLLAQTAQQWDEQGQGAFLRFFPFCATILIIIAVTAALSIGLVYALRAWKRPKPGCCTVCGYNLHAHIQGDTNSESTPDAPI